MGIISMRTDRGRTRGYYIAPLCPSALLDSPSRTGGQLVRSSFGDSRFSFADKVSATLTSIAIHQEQLAELEPDFPGEVCSVHVLPFLEPEPAMLRRLADHYQQGGFCQQCGECCRACVDGTYVSDREIATISDRLRMKARKFRRRHVVTTWCNPQAIRIPCPFLKGNVCTIYDIRPEMCKQFPICGRLYNGQEFVAVHNCPGGLAFTRSVIDGIAKTIRAGCVNTTGGEA